MCSIGTKVDLLGSNAKEATIVDQWAHFAEHEITNPTYGISSLIRGFVPFNREVSIRVTTDNGLASSEALAVGA